MVELSDQGLHRGGDDGDQGTINWALDKISLGPVHIAYTSTAMWLAFSYIWLPYMVLPIYAA